MADLYLGKLFDPATKALGAPFAVDSADLTTHGIVIGMTGSGKTGLSIGIIEEALSAKIPVIVIDPKGDMTNLALAFDRLAPEQFAPWVDRDQAAREGKTPEQVAAETAEAWRKGLADWGIAPERVAEYAAGRRVRILTPGSNAGTPVNLIDSMAPPGIDFESAEEELRDEIDGIVTALLSLVGVKSDPVGGREYILLFTLIENAWRRNEGLNLEVLIGQVANPPIEKVGALPLEAFYPQKDRADLMLKLNSLLASPPFEAWRSGDPIDVEAWVRPADGVPSATIVYTAHLDDEERTFITALVLNRIVTWMRKQPGTGELRCLVYMDEIFGYFPPTANPPTKKPLLTLLKQARAYGVGVLLATQNPVDLDYRGLANMGFWAIGRLQTTQDQDRVKEGIEAALADSGSGFDFDSMIAGVQKRVFLVHDIHRKQPELVHSRWVMSYLRGPITLEEIRTLAGESPPAPPTASPVARAVESAAVVAAEPQPAPAPTPPPVLASAAPAMPAELRTRYLKLGGGTDAYPLLVVRASARYKPGSNSEERTRTIGFPIGPEMTAAEVVEGEIASIDDDAVADDVPPGLTFADLPAWVQEDGPKAIERALRDRLDDRLAISVLYDPATKATAGPDETPEAFAARLAAGPEVEAKRDALEAKIDQKQADLAARRDAESAKQMGKIADVGASILGGLFGRKRSVESIFRKASKPGSGSAAIAKLEGEIARLAEELHEVSTVDTARFEFREIKPAKTDVTVVRYDLVWVY